MAQEEIISSKYRYIQWGYESYKDTKTDEIRSDYIDRLNEQEQENKILKEALKLACIKLLKNEFRNDVNTIRALENDFIEQAKENIK